jgi:AcrR family transcriptional regulator
MDTKSRTYDMGVRGHAKAATRDAIITAVVECFLAERSLSSVTLGAVAERARVTVKTVLRHFGNRDGLIDAAWARTHQDVLAERVSPADDPEAAISVLIEHYERRGEVALLLLALEDDEPRARTMCDAGRMLHRAWVEEAFDAGLPERAAARSRLIDALVVATDVYCWKLLRRDRGLPITEVRDRMLLIATSVLASSKDSPDGRGDG